MKRQVTGIQNSPIYLSFFIHILKFTTKISPVRDDSFQAGGGVRSTEPLLEMIDLQS